LAKPEEIEMRIVAAGARRDLGELDAAVVTLTCKELNNETDEWALRLRYAYADALDAAGRKDEAREWLQSAPNLMRKSSLTPPKEPVSSYPQSDSPSWN